LRPALRKNYEPLIGGGNAGVSVPDMESIDAPEIRCVLILKADRLYAEALRQYTLHVFPAARVLVAWSVESARTLLSTEPVDIFVTGAGASMESDVLDLLAQRTAHPQCTQRVLVVTVRREYRVLAALRGLAIDGVFDSSNERPGEFVTALRAVSTGGRYWSQSVLDHMHKVGSASTALFRLLTTFEQVVLSVIGDGCDNTVAARALKLSPATVSTVRRELHRKLGVQHRGELVRLAAQHGFVRFTAAGVVRPGFGIMCAAYQARRTRRSEARTSLPEVHPARFPPVRKIA
jgi:DNA-binding NarL/FixJ family response regulator